MTRFWQAALVAVAIGCAALASAQTADRRLSVGDTASGRRVALVVGNDAYAAAPLQNAVADARAMAATLRDSGFEVTLIENATRTAMATAIASVADALRPADTALFFYAGHGMQLGGDNYLIPVDFSAATQTGARLNALAATEVQEAFRQAQVSLIVLDACRNNPFSGQRGAAGLAPMEARGSLVAFATGAGQTASDNQGAANGLFTQELLRALKEPDLSIRNVFYRVRQRVYEATNGQQFPAVYDGLIGDLVVRAGVAGPAPVAAPAPNASQPSPRVDSDDLARREELALWEGIKDSRDPAVFEEYLQQNPQGRFRLAARERLNLLNVESALSARPSDFAGTWSRVLGSTGRTAANAAAELPLNAMGRALAQSWDPARDEAAGDQCKSYGAPSIMGQQGSMRLSWVNDYTLRLDFDAGTQTRFFYFAGRSTSHDRAVLDAVAQAGESTWQGRSFAEFVPPGAGSFDVVTNGLRPGYLGKNGAPYSARTLVRESFTLMRSQDGSIRLNVRATITDPEYLTAPLVIEHRYERKSPALWNPTPCTAR